MSKKHPTHPGKVIKLRCLEALDLTVTEAAKSLDVSRPNFSALLNEKMGVSPDMALKLAHVFGGTPEMWLKLQMQYDLANAREKFSPERLIKHAPSSAYSEEQRV
ncbi:MAG: HigA family addiction module antitoxin [Bdellovibrionales bacterium]